LVANGNLCLACHQVGQIEAKQNAGPGLDLASLRLRPEWTQYWQANPQRFLHYTTIMPINFKANAKEYADQFIGHGTEKEFSEDQIKAIRDYLMVYPQVVNWPILKYSPVTGTSGGN
jgi:hypothetical protein